ncbi:MAG: Fe-Mn family superoxide dismutase [bacterium]
MENYKLKTFNIGELKGISTKNIDEHLKLYAGYVKHTNLILEKIGSLDTSDTTNAYIISELQRRFAFEFGGMRNHEYYFSSLADGANAITAGGALEQALIEDFGSFDAWLTKFKTLALTRGIGWAMLSYDKESGKLINHWVDEQHVGHLVSTSPIIALDMWEHAFVYDYPTSEKKNYIDAFFNNLNWQIVEKNLEK